MSKKYLKSRARVGTRGFMLAGAMVLAWVNLGMPTTLTTFTPEAWNKALAPSALLLVAIIAAALDSVPGHDLKARLVFWRWKHPLPGSRAFQRAGLARDTRIDRTRLKERMGGSFPLGPADQNAAWYRLYKDVEHDPRVDGAQLDYLLFRDLTWFALLLAVASVICAIVNPAARNGSLWSTAAFSALTFTFSRAAAERGVRFVNTVLALTSAMPSSSETDGTKQRVA
ncbi:MAG: hypothetical protein PHS79_03950 [Patescibacteria group bacterium]|nr:hypothetical protein [Patescibacteria group bacterium]